MLDDLQWFGAPPIKMQSLDGVIETANCLRLLHTMKWCMMICFALLFIDNKSLLYRIICQIISLLSSIHLLHSMYNMHNRLKHNGFDTRIIDRINSKRYRLCILGNICLIILVSMYYADLLVQLAIFGVFIVLFWCTTAVSVSSMLVWIFGYFTCHVYDKDVQIVFWIFLILFGFLLIEVETRRIARCSKWKTYKRQEFWLRGCWCANCIFKCCCYGIYDAA